LISLSLADQKVKSALVVLVIDLVKDEEIQKAIQTLVLKIIEQPSTLEAYHIDFC
jgi:hypothetical protein